MGDSNDRSFGTVVRDIGGNVDRIVRTEMRIAIAELRDGMDAAGSASRYLVAGIALGTLAAAFLLLSVTVALARVMPMWGAALVVSALTGTAASWLLLEGRARIASRLPQRSDHIRSLPESTG
ncbi:MAG: phage holin family protein [Proteobacteria bacterium]|nr:phage holin family protein [Pseudomonadota bacterium]